MPALTRRRSTDAHRDIWNVYYGDVRVGAIGGRAGVRACRCTSTNGAGNAASIPA